MTFNARQIREIFITKSAIQDRLYHGHDGIIYRGLADGDMEVWENVGQVTNIINQTIEALGGGGTGAVGADGIDGVDGIDGLDGIGGLTQSQVSAIGMFRL